MSRTVQIEFSDPEWEEIERAAQVYQEAPLRYVRSVAVADARSTNIAEDAAQERSLQRVLQRQRLGAIRSKLRPRAPGVGPRDSRRLKEASHLRDVRSERGIAR